MSLDRRAQEISDKEQLLASQRAIAEKISRDAPSKLSDEDKKIAKYVNSDRSDEGAGYIDGLLASMSYDEAKVFLDNRKVKIESKRTSLKLAQAEIEAFRTKSEKTDAKIVVTAAITNSGDGFITLKPQALLRTDLGQGNYLDINLKILNPERNSEIKPRGASIATF